MTPGLTIIGLLVITTTAIGYGFAEHRTAQDALAQVGELQHDITIWKKAVASAENRAINLQLQVETLHNQLDEKTALLKIIQNH